MKKINNYRKRIEYRLSKEDCNIHDEEIEKDQEFKLILNISLSLLRGLPNNGKLVKEFESKLNDELISRLIYQNKNSAVLLTDIQKSLNNRVDNSLLTDIQKFFYNFDDKSIDRENKWAEFIGILKKISGPVLLIVLLIVGIIYSLKNKNLLAKPNNFKLNSFNTPKKIFSFARVKKKF
jgi:hypothetical protein